MTKTILILLTFFALTFFSAPASAQIKPGNAENGKRLFSFNGCYQCHGTVGQGGSAGARLAQTKLTLPGFLAFVRNPPPSMMPPYRAKIMPDQDLADVYAYIQTFPAPLNPSTIPLLNP
jgi:mono/diheme cytochrome c family protein